MDGQQLSECCDLSLYSLRPVVVCPAYARSHAHTSACMDACICTASPARNPCATGAPQAAGRQRGSCAGMGAAWQDACCEMRVRRPPFETNTGFAKSQHAATSDHMLQGSAGRVQLVFATECNPQHPRCSPVSPVARCSISIYAITNSDQLHQRDVATDGRTDERAADCCTDAFKLG